ncbi:D-alanine/D-alanine ligase [Paenibacillus curdlanolyticus YK9]|uniref:D-alanine--D-alanine ligase n=1 Tax=Paenibacillus curdlanolyticus YK9 TaxID=717606 RepID=E0IAX8_9BACL|nr:D-alanine--D-alanine ligase [Paenibacillus curdlanolyticus]EFM10269.1 D-alanine/D-alanine ligase [Paenibacillus curdlanolyticus YK9]
MGEKVRVGLIYGGKSGEHEVSLRTALAVMGEFDFSRYEVKPFYITTDGQWRTADVLLAPPADVAALRLGGAEQADAAAIGSGGALAPVFQGLQAGSASHGGNGAVDVIFPLLHGTFGEDGTIQGLLEMANIPYVGAGVLASAVGMDKVMMKKVFAHEGLPQCMFRYFNRTQWDKETDYYVTEIEVSLGYPCFIKPANLGSSVGISKAKNREELIEAINYAFRYDRKVIVEEFVDAREIEVSVLGNDEPKASVPGEIRPSNDFYDYKAKYIDGTSVMEIPANIPALTSEAVREMAIRAYQAIDGSGLSRVDFFMRKSDGELFINEVNTMPGFTPFSMYPLMWQETGLPYRELLDTLIELALQRHADKQRIDYGGGSPL